MKRSWIDLNADLGEGSANDAALMQVITSANIACGGHAGDDETIHRSIETALANGVNIGAHPGFEAKENFGRERLELSSSELQDQMVRQCERIKTIAKEFDTKVSYVKLHGALANMTAEDSSLAKTAYEATSAVLPDASILTISGTAQARACIDLGLTHFDEVFADRAYTKDGQLASRGLDGAVLNDEASVVEQISKLLATGQVQALTGETIALSAHSICVHGDNTHALDIAKAVKRTIQSADIELRSFI